MKFYVYILNSKSRDRFYTGQCKDVGDRFLRHNQSRNRSTKSGRPWRLMFVEQFERRSEAIKRERYIKKMKDRSYIIDLISNYVP
jgi:putative endonuclease